MMMMKSINTSHFSLHFERPYFIKHKKVNYGIELTLAQQLQYEY